MYLQLPCYKLVFFKGLQNYITVLNAFQIHFLQVYGNVLRYEYINLENLKSS